MTVTISNELLANITLPEQDVLVDIAIGLYKREQVSLGGRPKSAACRRRNS